MNAGRMQMPLLGGIKTSVEQGALGIQMTGSSPFAALVGQLVKENEIPSKSAERSQPQQTDGLNWIIDILQILGSLPPNNDVQSNDESQSVNNLQSFHHLQSFDRLSSYNHLQSFDGIPLFNSLQSVGTKESLGDLPLLKPVLEKQDFGLETLTLQSGTLQKALEMLSESFRKWLGKGAPAVERNQSKVQKEPIEQLITLLEGLVALPVEQWKTLDPNIVLPLLKNAKQLTNSRGNALSTKEAASIRWIQELLSSISQKIEMALGETSNKQLAILQKAYSNYVQSLKSDQSEEAHQQVSSYSNDSPSQLANGEQKWGQELIDTLGKNVKGKITINEHGGLPFSSFHSNTMSGETFSLPLQTVPKPMNIQQFIDKFRQILEKSHFAKQPNGNTLLIKLYPEHLGSLRIELMQKDGAVTARILASAQTVKDLIDSSLSSLKQAFIQQNIAIDKLEVVFHQPELDTFHRDSSGGGRQEQQQPQNQQEKETEESDHSFEELLINMEV